MRDYLLVVVVILCSFIALRRPVFGMLTYVCFGFLNPHSMTWTIAQSFPFAQFIGISTIIGYLFWPEPKRFPLYRESLFLLILWGVFGISTLDAFYPETALERFIHISKIFLMVFLSTSIINSEARLHWLLRVIALSIGFYGLKSGIFSFMTGGQYMVWGPVRSFLFANTAIGLALAMNIPLLLYLMKIEPRRWLRRVMMAMLVLSYPAIICTYSRGAWLSLAVVTALIILKSKYKPLLVPAVFLFAMTVLPSLLQYTPQRLAQRYDALVNYEQEESAQSRFWNWEFCKRVGLANPLTGGGFNFYSREIQQSYYPELVEHFGRVWSCHSMWLTMFGEHGFPGVILWIGLLGFYVLSLKQLRTYAKADAKFAWLIHYVDMLELAIVPFLVGGTFLDVAYFDMFYYLVAVLIVLKEIRQRAAVEVPSMAVPQAWIAASSPMKHPLPGWVSTTRAPPL